MSSVACSRLPTLQTLDRWPRDRLEKPGRTILDRQPNTYTSTFPSEIVRCRSAMGRELRFFCKYGGDHSIVPVWENRP